MVGDGDTVRRACQIFQDVLGLAERFFGVDDPVLVAYVSEELAPRLELGELATATQQGQVALSIEGRQPRQVQSPKALREDPDGQEAVRPTWHPAGAMSREPAGGQHTMQMRVMTTTVTIP